MLCNVLGGWDCGTEDQEGGNIFTHIVDSLCSAAKLTQHCKAIIANNKIF